MKLIGDKIEVETAGLVEEASFGIAEEDMGLVLEILRSKLYADPISAICREISCNARDAHREVGTPEKPITIVFPSKFDSHFRVIDEGPGITPERMKNVFIKFGSSTKRESNVQTGGFGLGAKTPFAYCDQFQIITVTDINHPRPANTLPRMKRVYSAYIDETKRGILALLEEGPTDAPRGTQIAIPVKPEHYSEFISKTERACIWWDVLPTIEGGEVGSIQWRKPNPAHLVMEGPGWKIYDVNNQDRYGRRNTEPTILIDQIAYPLDTEFTSGYSGTRSQNKALHLLFGGFKQLVLSFPNGQLTLSANRETIHWNVETKKLVLDKLLEISNEVKGRLQVDVEACETYIDASSKANQFKSMFNYSSDDEVLGFTWHGQKLYHGFNQPGSGHNNPWYDFRLVKSPGFPREEHDVLREKGGYYGGYYTLSWTKILVINDVNLGMLSPKRAAQIFNALPQACVGFTLVPEQHVSPQTLFGQALRHIPYVRLSHFLTKEQAAPKERKVRKLIYIHSSGTFNLSSAEDFDRDTVIPDPLKPGTFKKRIKLWVLLDRDKYDNRLSWSGRKNSVNLLSRLEREYNVHIYGVEKTLYEKQPATFSDFETHTVPVLDFIRKHILDKANAEALKPYYQHAQKHERPCAEAFRQFVELVNNPAEFAEYIRLDEEIRKNVNLALHTEFYMEVFNETLRYIATQPDVIAPGELAACDKIAETLLGRYPLLQHVARGGSLYVRGDRGLREEMSAAYAEYINMMDDAKGYSPVAKN